MHFIYTWVGLLQAPQFNLLHTTVIQSDPHSVTALVSAPLTVFPCLSELLLIYLHNASQIYWGCLFNITWVTVPVGMLEKIINCTFFCLMQTGFVKSVLPWLFILIPKVFGKQRFVLGSHSFVMAMLLLLFYESCEESVRQPLELFMCLSLICYSFDKY